MANYKESAVVGSTHQRAWRVEIENPMVGQKHITFHEETVVSLDGGDSMRRGAGSVTKFYNESTKDTSFNLLDPVNGNVTGSMTHEELYIALHSLYIASAVERDAQEAAKAAASQE